MGCTRLKKHGSIRALSQRVKCSCSVQRIRTNINNLTSAQPYVVRLPASFQKQVYIFSQEGLKGRNVALNLMITITRSPWQVV